MSNLFVNFEFKASPVFVNPGFESAPGEYSDKEREEISHIRKAHPELSNWGDLAIAVAWSDYSQNCHLLTWADWAIGERDELFLSYCAWQQLRGAWPWGGDTEELSAFRPWDGNSTTAQ